MAYNGYSSPYLLGRSGQSVLGNVDILGNDLQVLGQEMDEIRELLGAVLSRTPARALARAPMRAPLSLPARGGGAASNMVATSQPNQTRRLDLTVDSVAAVGAGLTAVITVTPPEPIRVEQVMVDPTIAPSFIINSAIIGRASQVIGTGSLAATLCSPQNPFAVQWDTAQTSQPIVLSVTNTSGGALRFMGSLRGTVVTR